jgi:aminoglycoside phosphotransferase (APT) family kinase protein
MSKGAIVGEGRVAEVFAWEEGQVLKLFRAWYPPEGVHYEARIARTVQATGLAVPAVGEVVQVDGRWGIVYGRVAGRSMLEHFTRKPWALARFARILAELHATMHARAAPGLPSLRRRLEGKIQNAAPLPAGLKAAALQALARLPDGNALCHGDFHPHNVLMSPQGPIVIDWPDATRGHPLADVARTCLLMRTGGLPSSAPRRGLIQVVRATFRAVYLRRYFQLRPGSRELLAAWQVPVAAGRLEEGIVEEEEQLVALVKASLQG